MSEKGLAEHFNNQFDEDRKKLLQQAGMGVDSMVEDDMYKDFRDEGDQDIESQRKIQPELNLGDTGHLNIDQFPDEEYYDQYADHEIRSEEMELFPDGPLMSEVEAWKKQYEVHGHRIVVTEIGEDVFVFRTLNRYEYKQIVAIPNSNPITREEVFCKTCVLWPPMSYQSMTQGKGGVPSTLAQVIMEHSGFVRNWEAKIL